MTKPHFRLHCRMPSASRLYGNVIRPEDRQWRVTGGGISTHWHLYSGNAIKKARSRLRYLSRIGARVCACS